MAIHSHTDILTAFLFYLQIKMTKKQEIISRCVFKTLYVYMMMSFTHPTTTVIQQIHNIYSLGLKTQCQLLENISQESENVCLSEPRNTQGYTLLIQMFITISYLKFKFFYSTYTYTLNFYTKSCQTFPFLSQHVQLKNARVKKIILCYYSEFSYLNIKSYKSTLLKINPIFFIKHQWY